MGGAPGIAGEPCTQTGLTMWKTIGYLSALCAVFIALLITLSIVGM
jgi:hypothetical protein